MALKPKALKPRDPTPYVEWSPTLVRARVEMFSTAVVFLAFAAWPVKLAHLPFVGLDIEGTISRWEILLPLLLFYIYAAVSFFVRSRVENNRLIDPAGQIQRALANVNEFIAELRGIDLTQQIPPFIDALKSLSVRSTLEGENPNTAFANRLAGFVKTLETLPLPADSASIAAEKMVQGLHQIGVQDLAKLGIRIRAEVDRAYEETTSAVTTIRSELLSLQADLARGHKEYSELSEQTVARLTEVREELIQLQARQGGELTAALRSSNAEMNQIRRDLARVAGFEMFERSILSFWLPLVTSLSAIVLGIALAGDAILPWVVHHHWAEGALWR